MSSVVVLGAGYAGVMAANRLAGRGERVTLVSPETWFVERIRLHRVAAGTRPDARVELDDLVHPDVERVLDRAVRIHAGERAVALAGGGTLAYSTLVHTVGSGAPRRPATPHDDDAAVAPVHRISDEASAAVLRAALEARPEAPVTIVGAGLTGIELAAVLAHRPAGVRLFTASPMTARAAERAHVRRLRRLGVAVETGVRADVVEPAAGPGIVVETTGLLVPSLAADSGLPVDRAGRLIVGEDLAVVGTPSILAAGDAAAIDSPTASHLRMACATALPMGAHAADVVAARRAGATPPPFRLGYVAQCSDLGGAIGRIQLVRGDDSERPLAVPGLAGGFVKEQVCRMTLTWLTQERARAGRYTWSAQPRRVRATEQGVTLGSAR